MDTTGLTGAWGPHDQWDRLTADMKAAGGPLSDQERIEELFRYDGTSIDLMRSKDGSVWLTYVYDEGPRPEEGKASEMLIASHHLMLSDLDAARATLDEGYLPTEETYRLASLIVSEKLHYVLQDRLTTACRGERRIVTFDEAMSDDAIYRQIRPDGSMVFGPLEDPFEPLAGDDRHLYRYPVPQDRMLVDFDGPRNWVGRFEDGPDEIHLVVCIEDDKTGYLQHRLTFDSKDERSMLDTLAAAQAPTMDTYRLAREIRTERIVHGDGGSILTVARTSIDDEAFSRPTYENVAAHDAEWPQFARRA